MTQEFSVITDLNFLQENEVVVGSKLGDSVFALVRHLTFMAGDTYFGSENSRRILR
jgi:hypothetical protein